MKVDKILANILVLGLIILIGFDLVYPSKGDDVSRVVPQAGRAFMFLFMLFANMVLAVEYEKITINKTLIIVFAFFLYTTIAFIFRFEYISINFMQYIKTVYWIIGFALIFFLVSNGFLTYKHLYFFTVVSVILFFLIILRDFGNTALFGGTKNYFISNNGYNLLRFFPLTFLIKKPKIKYSLISIITIGVVLSLKRGTILAFVISFLFAYLAILLNTKKQLFINKRMMMLFGIILIGVFSYLINANIEAFSHRMADFNSIESMGSGRIYLYSLIIEEMLYNSPIIRIFFGYGFLATIQYFQITIGHSIVAHSDIIELFYDFGVIGLTLLFLFFSSIFNFTKKLRKTMFNEWLAMSVWLIIIVFTSIYSMNIFRPDMIYSVFLIAYLQGNIRYSRRLNYNQLIMQEYSNNIKKL